MVNKDEIQAVLDKMILSASGWRGIFSACGEEEGSKEQISEAHCIISGAAALVFAEYLCNTGNSKENNQQTHQKNTTGTKCRILLGCDTRPTSKTIANIMLPVLKSLGCEVFYTGFTAAPEIMAWAKSFNTAESDIITGFIYISASHNPIGYNGIKFGRTDGGVLAAEEAAKLITNFRLFMERDDCIAIIAGIQKKDENHRVSQGIEKKTAYTSESSAKTAGLRAYYDFCNEVAWGDNTGSYIILNTLKEGLEKHPLGIVCDFNGSARTVSIDKDFFTSLGLKFECINDKPGQIVHRIVPEGESLEPCRELLENTHKKDTTFMLGYMPDCDGDRGNLVIWDDTAGKARILEAQEVFALACVSEFSHLVWTNQIDPLSPSAKAGAAKAAVAINDPTSLRIDRIAKAYGISVFRAEVGEANVVGLARELREKEGYIVRILGEGSAGGIITHPSAVRDPMHTVLALVKLLSIRSKAGKSGFFEIWCKLSGQVDIYKEDFTLADIIKSLPPFTTTGAYTEEAVLRINIKDHSLLKNCYQQIFMQEWEENKILLKNKYGIHSWKAFAYNGMIKERHYLKHFGDAGTGGLKILFFPSDIKSYVIINNDADSYIKDHDIEGKAIAAIWMRGSATEPVFRIMADTAGTDKEFERFLLNWQHRMIMKAYLNSIPRQL